MWMKSTEWIPSTFKRPDPEPYADWDVHTTKPILYRPFRYGPYVFFVSLSIQSDDTDGNIV